MQVCMWVGEWTACYSRVSTIIVSVKKLPRYNDNNNEYSKNENLKILLCREDFTFVCLSSCFG